MFSGFKRFKESMSRREGLAREKIDLSKYIHASDFSLEKEPFPHVVVGNFFKEDLYRDLSNYFKSILDRGLSESESTTKFKPFLGRREKFEYDGYIYTPDPGEDVTLEPFFSVAWSRLFSQLFDQPIGLCTSLALHYHPSENRTGYVHNDYSVRWFSSLDTIQNNIIFRERGRDEFPNQQPQMRSIALIYYLGNDSWDQGDGGETGLYEQKNGVPVKAVAPINNRLFAFRISPNSFHAFQRNLKPRSSIIQWFHTDPRWSKKTYGFIPE